MTNEKLTRKELEDAINNSEFFTLNKEDNPDVYETEHRKLIEIIYTYVFNVFPITKNNEFNFEIMETMRKAFKNYNKSYGCFINYFNHLMKLTLKITRRKRELDDRCGGMTISKGKRATVAKIFKFAEVNNFDITDEKFLIKVIKLLHLKISPAEVLALNNARVISETSEVGEDGEGYSVYDMTADAAPTPDERSIADDTREQFLIAFEKVYKESRETSKERNRLILSYILFFENDETGEEITDRKPPRFFMRYSFIDERVLNAFYSGEKLTQKDIAQMAGVSAVAITKAKNLLLEELKEKLKRGAVFNS